jgi:hypothetical protein
MSALVQAWRDQEDSKSLTWYLPYILGAVLIITLVLAAKRSLKTRSERLIVEKESEAAPMGFGSCD